MVQIDNTSIIEQHEAFLHAYTSGASAPFVVSDYMGLAFPKLEERAYSDRLKKMRKRTGEDLQSVFPYQVLIPKSLDAMINGDFEPAKVITVKEPFKGPYSDIWFGDTTDGVAFRWGYLNGDSRKISDQALDDTTVHGFLGGATGQGKSVTLNSVLYGCCMEYPPWELTLTLSDAKIVEFKSIALKHPMPHIDIIAATADADYMLSMLHVKHDEMIKRQSVFTTAAKVFGHECKNIMQFRKITNLCMPRVVIVMDECTAMFQQAGSKKAAAIANELDSFARLGRNAGMHIFLASQEVSADLPQATMNNLTLRGAMGCPGAVSERILGNDEAVYNMGRKGHLLVNTKSNEKNNSAYNKFIRVPFLPDEQITAIADTAISLGKQLGVTPTLRFYDEEEKLYEDKYVALLNQYKARNDRILLGPPSFIMDGDVQMVQILLNGADMENICVFANATASKLRSFKMLNANMKRITNAEHIILCTDNIFGQEAGIDSLNPLLSFDSKSYEDNQFFEVARATIYRRALCVKADLRAFEDCTTSENVDKYFYQRFEKGSKYDTVLNRCRAKYYLGLAKSDAEIRNGLLLDSFRGEELDEKLLSTMEACIRMCEKSGCLETPITRESMSQAFFWLFGMERLIGVGRDSKTKNVESFKKLLQDGTPYNVRFVVFTSTFEELGSLYETFSAFLSEDLSSKQKTQIKAADDYPENLSKALMTLYNPHIQTEGRVVKFKKLMLDGEL